MLFKEAREVRRIPGNVYEVSLNLSLEPGAVVALGFMTDRLKYFRYLFQFE